MGDCAVEPKTVENLSVVVVEEWNRKYHARVGVLFTMYRMLMNPMVDTGRRKIPSFRNYELSVYVRDAKILPSKFVQVLTIN